MNRFYIPPKKAKTPEQRSSLGCLSPKNKRFSFEYGSLCSEMEEKSHQLHEDLSKADTELKSEYLHFKSVAGTEQVMCQNRIIELILKKRRCQKQLKVIEPTTEKDKDVPEVTQASESPIKNRTTLQRNDGTSYFDHSKKLDRIGTMGLQLGPK